MILLEFIATSWLIFWSFVIIFIYQYVKNTRKISEGVELPPIEINVSKQLKEVISEIEDNIISKINIESIKSDIKIELHTELNVLRENLISFVDVFEKKISESLPKIKLPDLSLINEQIANFKIPEIENIKGEIKQEIQNAFTEENVEKIAQSVLKSLSENMKGEEQPGTGGMDIANLDMNNILKMVAMQYLQKFMGGGGGDQSVQPNQSVPSKQGF